MFGLEKEQKTGGVKFLIGGTVTGLAIKKTDSDPVVRPRFSIACWGDSAYVKMETLVDADKIKDGDWVEVLAESKEYSGKRTIGFCELLTVNGKKVERLPTAKQTNAA